MDNPVKAVILDDETVVIDGRTLVGQEDIAEALRSALQRDPDFILVIEPMENAHYKGIGKVLYTSQRIGVPLGNVRYTTENGEVVTLDALRARGP
jgi:hypothetical protein